MLRKIGLTPSQLAEQFKLFNELNYEDKDFEKLFGKEPYEFLNTEGREFPNYSDFYPQFVDQNGLQYSTTEDERHFFVRIPISITRKFNNTDSRAEDYTGFPKQGDTLTLFSGNKMLQGTVLDCPYWKRRAVSNIYFRNIFEIDFIPDFIGSEGLLFSKCDRKCRSFLTEIDPQTDLIADFFVSNPVQSQLNPDSKDDNTQFIESCLDKYNISAKRQVTSAMTYPKKNTKRSKTENQESFDSKYLENDGDLVHKYKKRKIVDCDKDGQTADNSNLQTEDQSIKDIEVKANSTEPHTTSILQNKQSLIKKTVDYFVENTQPYETDLYETKDFSNIYNIMKKKVNIFIEKDFDLNFVPKKNKTIRCYQMFGDRIIQFKVINVKSHQSIKFPCILTLKFEKLEF